jgi:hypothetical protein
MAFSQHLILTHHLGIWSSSSYTMEFRQHLILTRHIGIWSSSSYSMEFRQHLILTHHLGIWSSPSYSMEFRQHLISTHHLGIWSSSSYSMEFGIGLSLYVTLPFNTYWHISLPSPRAGHIGCLVTVSIIGFLGVGLALHRLWWPDGFPMSPLNQFMSPLNQFIQ